MPISVHRYALGCLVLNSEWSPSIKRQILVTDLHTFSYTISYENLLKDQSNSPLVMILLILITFSLDCALILWGAIWWWSLLLTMDFFLVSLYFPDHGLLNFELFGIYSYGGLTKKEKRKKEIEEIEIALNLSLRQRGSFLSFCTHPFPFSFSSNSFTLSLSICAR